MTRVPGFDYRTGQPVEKSRKEWRELERAGSAKRVAGDLLIRGPDGKIVAEMYDREPQEDWLSL